MEIKNRSLTFVMLIFLFMGVSQFIFAQIPQSGGPGYFLVSTEGGEPRFIQRLVWSGGEYALRYEVVIQREENGIYVSHFNDFVLDLFINVSLSPGRYRFQVIPYDILDMPGEGSLWMNFEVLHATRPELHDGYPEYFFADNNDTPSGYVLNITGNNLTADAEIIIRRPDGALYAPAILGSPDSNSIRIFIENGVLIPGEYEITIRNPGGLEAVVGGIFLSPEDIYSLAEAGIFPGQSPFETEQIPGAGILTMPEAEIVYVQEPEFVFEPVFVPEFIFEPVFVSEIAQEPESLPQQRVRGVFDPLKRALFRTGAAFKLLIPIYGDSYDNEISFFGMQGHISALFGVTSALYLGTDLTVYLYEFNYNKNPQNALEFGANIMAMYWLSNQRIAFALRAGGGYVMLSRNADKISLNAGLSFHWRFENRSLLEVGIDYSNMFDDTIKMFSGGLSGSLRPWVGYSVKF